MTSDGIEEDAERLDAIVADLNREAANHRRLRDEYQEKAGILADKRDKLQKRARSLSAEANVYKERRDESNLTARECRGKRDQWNERVQRMRASGGLGDIDEARAQANSWHQKAEKASKSSDAAHKKMHQLFDEADRLRDEARTCQEQIADLRRAADIEHTRYIETVRRIDRVRNELPDRRRLICMPGNSLSTADLALAYEMPSPMEISTQLLPSRCISAIGPSRDVSTATASSAGSSLQALEKHEGHLDGTLDVFDSQEYPQRAHSNPRGSSIHLYDPHDGHLFGFPSLEFQTCPQRLHSSLRL